MYMGKIKAPPVVAASPPPPASMLVGIAFALVAIPWIALRVGAHVVMSDLRLLGRVFRACGAAVAEARR